MIYVTRLRALPFIVAPSYGQQESLQLRPDPALAGPLDALVSALHDHEIQERPVNRIVFQKFRYEPFSVLALSFRTSAEEPLSGRRGATLTMGCLLWTRPSQPIELSFLETCHKAIRGWTGGVTSLDSVSARVQSAISLNASDAGLQLALTFLSLSESAFGFSGRPSRMRRLGFRLFGPSRRIESAQTLDELLERIREIVKVREAEEPDRRPDVEGLTGLVVGAATASSILSGVVAANPLNIPSLILVMTLAAFVLISTGLVRLHGLWWSALRAMALTTIALTWMLMLAAHFLVALSR